MSDIKYILFMILGVALIMSVNFKRTRGSKLFNKSIPRKILDSRFVTLVNRGFGNVGAIVRLRDKYVNRLSLITTYETAADERLASALIFVAILVGLIVTILVSMVLPMWYIYLTLGGLCGYSVLYAANTVIHMKIKRIAREFPIAISIFTDYYMSFKNIKATLTNTYSEMPPLISGVMERLARELSSSSSIEEPILKFARSLDYIWGYAFAELLIISYEGVGDISNDLLFLNELINDDIREEEETKSEMMGNKMLFMAINMVTLLFFGLNIMANPLAKSLYLYTSFGNNAILLWVISVVAGMAASNIIEKI